MSKRPWNWCRTCKQAVDLPDGEISDGGEVTCHGCGGRFIAVAFTDGSWWLEYQRGTRRKPKASSSVGSIGATITKE